MTLFKATFSGADGLESACRAAKNYLALQLHDGKELRLTITEKKRTNPQNAKMHAMFADVARCMLYAGTRISEEDWKRLLVDAFQRATIRDPDFADLWAKVGTLRTVPSLDGSGVVTLGLQTRDFPVRLAAAMCDWLQAWGDENGVEWTEEKKWHSTLLQRAKKFVRYPE